MKKLKDELPGSKRGGAMTEIAPWILKRIRKIFKKNRTNDSGIGEMGEVIDSLSEDAKMGISPITIHIQNHFEKSVGAVILPSGTKDINDLIDIKNEE